MKYLTMKQGITYRVTIFFLVFLLAFPLFPLNTNLFIEALKEEKSTDTLYFMGSRFMMVDKEGKGTLFPPEELAFTDEVIKSLNITTRELVFTDSFIIDRSTFKEKMRTYQIYNIYLNDKLLLENVESPGQYSSRPVNDLVIYYSGLFNDEVYINDGFPVIPDNWYGEDVDIMREIRKANAEKRKAEWDIFIQHLRNAGKIIGDTITHIEPVATPELNAVSIYPNPTKGELRIENGELRIRNIQFFDIRGNIVLSPFPSPIWRGVSEGRGEVNISHLPAGIYFVQITTEKGVVTKKVVKR